MTIATWVLTAFTGVLAILTGVLAYMQYFSWKKKKLEIYIDFLKDEKHKAKDDINSKLEQMNNNYNSSRGNTVNSALSLLNTEVAANSNANLKRDIDYLRKYVKKCDNDLKTLMKKHVFSEKWFKEDKNEK